MKKIWSFIKNFLLICLLNWGKLVMLVMFILFMTAIVKHKPTRYNHPFTEGDIVCMKITGDKAQVIEARPDWEKVQVRIAITRSTSADGSTTTAQEYDRMRVYDYEIENCKGD